MSERGNPSATPSPVLSSPAQLSAARIPAPRARLPAELSLCQPRLPASEACLQTLATSRPIRHEGKITKIVGQRIEAQDSGHHLGGLCLIRDPQTGEHILGEVTGFRGERVLTMGLGTLKTLGPQCRVVPTYRSASATVSEHLQGRVIDGLGNPIDNGPPIAEAQERPLYLSPPSPTQRRPITQPLDVGVRSINALLTPAQGQRMAIMAGSGVGKSVLLGMMARHTTADVNVIALIGERGREVLEFIQGDLGTEGLRRSIVVVATSDAPPLVRIRAAFLAVTIAEFFRERGRQVLLLMDSLSRLAMAQREIGLSSGEPPTTKGYPPSVFALLPKLLERVGLSQASGSISGFFTTLAENDDLNDPIVDAVRAVVDGHLVLQRQLAERGQFPAVDVLASTSRVMHNVVGSVHRNAAQAFRSALAAYAEVEDLLRIGAYVQGSDPAMDAAIKARPAMIEFLTQPLAEKASFEQSLAALQQLAGRLAG